MRDNKDFIQNITLEYFSNKLTQDKINGNKSVKDKINKSDIKFYKKRIIHFTKELLKNEKQMNTSNSIENTFYNYIYTIIEHFKEEDRTDILQREHNNEVSNCNNKDKKLLNEYDISNMNISDIDLSDTETTDINKINNILINTKIEQNTNNTLDTFIIKKNTQNIVDFDTSNNNNINKLPQIKKIFLKEPEFKYKGMKKEEIDKLKEKEKKRKIKKEGGDVVPPYPSP